VLEMLEKDTEILRLSNVVSFTRRLLSFQQAKQ